MGLTHKHAPVAGSAARARRSTRTGGRCSDSCASRVLNFLEAIFQANCEPTHTIGPSLFRVIAGLALLSEQLISYSQRHVLFGRDNVLPYASYAKIAPFWSPYRYALDDLTFEFVYHSSAVVIGLWTLGLKTRYLTPLVLLFWKALEHRGFGLWDGGHNLISILLVYSCGMNLGAHLSVTPATLEGGSARILHRVGGLACGAQVCVVYFVAGVMKARGNTWLDGTALYYALVSPEFAWPGVTEFLYRNETLLGVVGPMTVFFQISFPFFYFLNRKTRLFCLIAGMAFHIQIAVFMGLITFAAFFIGAELALVSDSEYRRVSRWLASIGKSSRRSSREVRVA